MTIFKENKKTKLQCGINDFGELFIGDDKSGATLPNTPENKRRILKEFYYYDDKNWKFEN